MIQINLKIDYLIIYKKYYLIICFGKRFFKVNKKILLNVNNVEMCQLLKKLLIVFVWLWKGFNIFKKHLVSFIKKLFLKMIMPILVINVRKKLKHLKHIKLLLCHLIWSLFSRGLHILQQLAWERKFMIDFSFL